MLSVSSGEKSVTRFVPRTWHSTPCQASKCSGVMQPLEPIQMPLRSSLSLAGPPSMNCGTSMSSFSALNTAPRR